MPAMRQVVAGERGGQRIRTSKGLRPPVFKTGALPFGQPSRALSYAAGRSAVNARPCRILAMGGSGCTFEV